MKKKNIALVAVFLFFAIIYSLISIVNHYNFRTGSLDLGMFNHALYLFSHFKEAFFTLDARGAEVKYLGDHFSPITILFSPISYILGSYTLLIIQIASIIFGGLGIYKYAKLYFDKDLIPILLLIHFFSIWGIYSALSYDFHTNVVASMLVPWLFLSYKKENHLSFLIFYVLILIAKENMAIWLIFIMIGLVVDKQVSSNGKAKELFKFEIPLIVFSAIYSFIVLEKIMPAMRGEGFDQLSRYSHLGNGVTEIIRTLFTNPQYVFSLLFENPEVGNNLFGYKSELHFMILVSGGFVLFNKPQYLIMLLPIYGQKLLSGNSGMWGINDQYSIEFVPIISVCLIHFLLNFKKSKTQKAWLIVVLVSTVMFSGIKLERRQFGWFFRTRVAFYDKKHYESNLNLKEIYSELSNLPSNAALSVSPNIGPHVAFRDKLYHFPIIKDADYIVVFSNKRSTWPLSIEAFHKKISEIKEAGEFEVAYDENDLLIFKRTQ